MNIHNGIINISPDGSENDDWCNSREAYLYGHRDARHVAAELSLKYERALEEAIDCLKSLAENDINSLEDCQAWCRIALNDIKQILDN